MMKKTVWFLLCCIATSYTMQEKTVICGRLTLNPFSHSVCPNDDLYLVIQKELAKKDIPFNKNDIFISVFASNDDIHNWGTKDIPLFYKNHPKYSAYQKSGNKADLIEAKNSSRFPRFLPYSLLKYYKKNNVFGFLFCGRIISFLCQ